MRPCHAGFEHLVSYRSGIEPLPNGIVSNELHMSPTTQCSMFVFMTLGAFQLPWTQINTSAVHCYWSDDNYRLISSAPAS